MEITFVFGAAFLLLILVCWIVYRRSRQTSWGNYDLQDRIQPNLSVSDVDDTERIFSDGVELGPVTDDAQQDWSAETLEQEFEDHDVQSEENWDWHDDETTDEPGEFEQVSDDQVGQHAQTFVDSDSPVQAANETAFADQLDNTTLEGYPQAEEYQPEADYYDQPEATNNDELDEFEPVSTNGTARVEPSIGIQMDLPLRTTALNGHSNGSAASIIEHVNVDESIEFPNFRNSGPQVLDMLGWIPDNGESVSRVQLLSLMRSFGGKFNTPVSLYGHLEGSEVWRNFEEEDVAARFSDLIFTMQLTHRGASIDEQHWWQFFNMCEQIAKSLSRSFYPSLSMESALRLSDALTEQVGNLDLQAILILLSENGRQLSHRTMEYLAREYQLVMRDDGRIFDKPDILPQSLAPMFTLTTVLPERQGAVDADEVGLALYSNLPCVRDPLEAFDQMVDLARSLENRFPLMLVDEARNSVTTRDIGVIRSHILSFADDMNFCGIEPGGETALRLFGEPAPHQLKTDFPELAQLHTNS